MTVLLICARNSSLIFKQSDMSYTGLYDTDWLWGPLTGAVSWGIKQLEHEAACNNVLKCIM
jgi:hypothetical protein